MGSYASGRRSDRRCAEDLLRLDVRPLTRGRASGLNDSSLYWGQPDRLRCQAGLMRQGDVVDVAAAFRHCGDWKLARYRIELEWTPCRFGGRRAWWRCPAVGCGRRVAVLYGQGVFVCRKCCDISYRSQRESAGNRADRRANKIRRRLGWPVGIAHGSGPKPKGLHWKTFWRLKDEHDRFVLAAFLPWHERMVAVEARLQHLRREVRDL